MMNCAFCYLPISPAAESSPAGGPLYCCYGCRFAAEVTNARGEEGQVNWMLARLGIAVFMTMSVMMLSMFAYRQQAAGGIGDSQVGEQLGGLLQYASLLFATPVFILLGVPIFQAAMQQMRSGVVSTDALVVIGVGAAFVYSYVSTLRGVGHSYYETACAVLVFMTLGRWLEARGKLRASEAVRALERLLPDEVRVSRNGETLNLRPEAIVPGDILHVAAGDRIATDGEVLRGRAHVDEQLVSGESTPVLRDVGDVVRAGTLDVDGALQVRATAVGSASALGRLIELLEAARRSRSGYQRLADRIATVFIPLTVLLAIAGAALGFQRGGADDAILTALAVLLIACPCALGIATPTAIWVSLGRAAARRILIRDGQTLETLARVRCLLFDKTGTLTSGLPSIAEVVVADGAVVSREDVLLQAAALASTSRHALSQTLTSAAASPPPAANEVAESRTIAGRGVVATLRGTPVALGSPALMRDEGLFLDASLEAALAKAHREARTVACIGWDGRVQAVFTFDEVLRPDAADVMERLHRSRFDVAVLTGDHAARGKAMAASLGVPVHAELRPEQKLRHVIEAKARGGCVAMVGDGLNDAPALAAADVGIAMGCGADLTRESAAICLAGNDLMSIDWLVQLSRRTVRTIKVNLFWAFVYNLIGIGLAMAGMLSPIFAAGAMVVSSLLVLANSLRLNSFEDRSMSRATDAAVPMHSTGVELSSA
mgnify:CR=1 FL=1